MEDAGARRRSYAARFAARREQLPAAAQLRAAQPPADAAWLRLRIGAAGAAGAALRRATRPEGPLASCRYRAPCPAYVSASHAAYVDLALERPLGAVGGACGRRLARFAPRSGRWRTPVDPKPRPGAARHVLYVFPPHIQHVLQGRSSKNTRCKWCRTRNSWLPRPCQRSAGLCSIPRRVDCRSRRLHTTLAS